MRADCGGHRNPHLVFFWFWFCFFFFFFCLFSQGLAGVVGSIVLWRKKASAAIPKMFVGSIITATTYSSL